MAPSDVTATLFYLKPCEKWRKEKPYTLFVDVSNVKGASNTNIEKDAVPNVSIEDVRHRVAGLNIDRHGFEVVAVGHSELLAADRFEDTEWVKSRYYPFLCDLVAKRLGAEEVRVYEHKLRYRHPGFGDTRLRGAAEYDPPIPQVHADVSWEYGFEVFRSHWPDALSASRLQIVNLWRPLTSTVTEWPLALCDCCSVDRSSDLQATDQIKRLKGSTESDNQFVVMESYTAFHNPSHRWCYLRDQKIDEGWLIKLFDSDQEMAQGVLHTAIDIGQGVNARRSCCLIAAFNLFIVVPAMGVTLQLQRPVKNTIVTISYQRIQRKLKAVQV